jgi:hypothetical protein
MYALFVEVNADESHVADARTKLPEMAVPRARENGARAGYWLTPVDGRGVAVLIYDDEQQARTAAAGWEIGAPPPYAPVAGVTIRSVEVREILASL